MRMIYRALRPLLFRLPAERAHRAGTAVLGAMLALPTARRRLRAITLPEDSALAVERWGIRFPGPVCLAAGFDKAGTSINALGALGFAAVEIGTVTAHPQPGNPRPRLFRLPADRALVNRMGFNNPGADAVAERLQRTCVEPVLGINLGKSKVTPLEEAADDYLASLERLAALADYLVVNVSSPNTPGLRTLQDPTPLRALTEAVVARNRELAAARGSAPPPVLLKIAPDLADPDIDTVAELAGAAGIAGMIATNTTISRNGLRTGAERLEEIGAGGVSGAPLLERAVEVVARVRARTEGRLPIIGAGGIFGPGDAWRHLAAGASLVQLYTGFVYGGPGTPRRIHRGLRERLEAAGLGSIEELIGSGLPDPLA